MMLTGIVITEASGIPKTDQSTGEVMTENDDCY